MSKEIDGLTFAARLDSLIELIHDACLVLTPEGRILYVNEEASRLYGYTRDRLAEMHIRDLCAGESLRLPHNDLLSAAKDGLSFNSVHLRADGTEVPVRIGWKRSDFCGTEIVLVTVLDDCSHVSVEEERIKSAAFDAALDAIIVHDGDGQLLHFNHAAATAAGMSPEQFAEIGQWGWIPPSERACSLERIEHIFRAGSMVFEGIGRRADGTPYNYEAHARSLELIGRKIIVSVVHDITKRKRSEAAIRDLAYHDVLTGLPNRTLLSQRAEEAMDEARRHGDICGVAFIDLDDFKPINDNLGHSAGDEALCTIADRLVASVRGGDTVARLGGDEFVAMLTRLENRGALERLGEKLSAVVREPLCLNGHRVIVTASIGLALFDPAEDALSSLLSKADMAMYVAKRAGKPWHVFDESNVPR